MARSLSDQFSFSLAIRRLITTENVGVECAAFKLVTCDQASGGQSGFSKARKKYAWYIYCTSRLPPVQNLVFCLIGRKTKESLTVSLSHNPIGYMIACLTSGAISRQEAVMATVEGDASSEFSAALTPSLDDLIHKSRMSRQNTSKGLLA